MKSKRRIKRGSDSGNVVSLESRNIVGLARLEGLASLVRLRLEFCPTQGHQGLPIGDCAATDVAI